MPKISPENIQQTYETIANTDKSVRTIAKELKINETYLRRKLTQTDEGRLRYARAKSEQAELMIECINDKVKELKEKLDSGRYDPKTHSALVQTYKLEWENLKWMASKLIPKIYGDSLSLSGSITHKVEPPKNLNLLTDEELTTLKALNTKAIGNDNSEDKK